MRVAFISQHDPQDVKSWSGLCHFMWHALMQQKVEVELIGPLPLPLHRRTSNWLKRNFYSRLHGQLYWQDGDVDNAIAWSQAAGRRLQALPPVDAVLSATALPTAFLPGKVPLITYADATMRSLFESYPDHARMPAFSRRDAELIEGAAHVRASALIYASQWAANSAVQDYGVDARKVHVVPFGANLAVAPTSQEVIGAIASRDSAILRLVFIGREWERKGGPLAVAVTRQLNQLGCPARLTIIGATPKLSPAEAEWVTQLGFIEKNADGQARIHAELARSHFLLVPSQAECFGLVYCEASAYGVPSIAKDVGGVSSAVRNGRNGQLFGPQAGAQEIAAWIKEKTTSPLAYQTLACAARAEFEAELNWQVAGSRLVTIIKQVVNKVAAH
ncbi:MAG TPA: glycosyltransferase family 4 protein [Verrucomicrobiae bacterium]